LGSVEDSRATPCEKVDGVSSHHRHPAKDGPAKQAQPSAGTPGRAI